MVKTPKTIQPIEANFDDLAKSLIKRSDPNRQLSAEYTGELLIGNLTIPCHVLEDKTRVLSGRGMQNSLGFSKTSSGSALTNFVNSKLTDFIPKESMEKIKKPIAFKRIGSGGSAPHTNGYDATILIDICNAIIQANRKGLLTETQQQYAEGAEIIISSVAKVGIIALVDEATGYQEDRAKDALAEILAKFLVEERQKWTRTFPLDFYKEIYRLRGWEFKPWTTKRPSVIASWTDNFVYDRIAPEITKELRKKNPKPEKGRRKNKHFQWLSPEYGHPRLKEHLSGVIALLKASETWEQFLKSLDRAYPKYGNTIELPLTGGEGKDS